MAVHLYLDPSVLRPYILEDIDKYCGCSFLYDHFSDSPFNMKPWSP